MHIQVCNIWMLSSCASNQVSCYFLHTFDTMYKHIDTLLSISLCTLGNKQIEITQIQVKHATMLTNHFAWLMAHSYILTTGWHGAYCTCRSKDFSALNIVQYLHKTSILWWGQLLVCAYPSETHTETYLMDGSEPSSIRQTSHTDVSRGRVL